MLEILVTLPLIALVVYGIIKGWYTQAVLIVAGFALLIAGWLLGNSPIIPEAAAGGVKPTAFWFFDLFEKLRGMFSFNAAELGMNIMAVGGFAAYMSDIGASHAMVRISTSPMAKLKSPYLVIALGYIIGAFLNMFITSATGLGLLLMATMYPIFRGLGLSRLSAAAPIASTAALELGPTQSNVIYAAGQSGMEVTQYVFGYQLPVAVPAMLVMAGLHFFWQNVMDHRDGTPPGAERMVKGEAKSKEQKDIAKAPGYYALLNMIPLVFVIVFSKITNVGYSIHLVTAILVSIFICIVVDMIHEKSVKNAFQSFKAFMDGMGSVFSSVVTLVIAAGIFADGLKQIGVIDMILQSASGAGFTPAAMMLVIVLVIGVSAVLMGSGNASFLAFGELVPKIAAKFNVDAAKMLLPMQETSSLARTFSPITAVIIAVAGLAEIQPFDLVKRTVVPVAGGIVTVILLNYIFFF
jgi:DcuC family C4-dicarboxylate transporter